MGEVLILLLLPPLSLRFYFSKLKSQISQFSPVLLDIYEPGGAQVSVCFYCLRALVFFNRSCSGNYVLPWIYTILVNHSQHIVSQEPVTQLLDSLHQVKSCFLHFSFMYVFLYMSLLLLLVLEIFNSVSPSPLWFVDCMKR